VSRVPGSQTAVACFRCQTPMREVMWIAPLREEPGLIAYECPSCKYVTSVFVMAEEQTKDDDPQAPPDRP
jgi:hypothetical protein